MPVARFMKLQKIDGELKVHVRWKVLSKEEDTDELIERVYADVPKLFLKLCERRNNPVDLASEARSVLHL